MLSIPPASLAKSVSACASAGGWRPAAPSRSTVSWTSRCRSVGVGAVVPESVAADEQPAVLGEVHGRGVRSEVVGRVDAEPAGDRVRAGARSRPPCVASRRSSAAAAKESSSLSCTAGSSRRRAASRPGCRRRCRRRRRVLDDRRHEGARRRAVGGRVVGGGGLRDRSLAATTVGQPGARPRPRRRGVPTPWGRAARSTSRAARERRGYAMWESVALETPSQTTSTARDPAGRVGAQRHGVLVAAYAACRCRRRRRPRAPAPR